MNTNNLKYFVLYKPYGMLSQFKSEGKNPGLETLNFKFPKDAYPVGRLDSDSEGLLLITNDKKINHLLLDPKFKHKRTYYAQVEGLVDPVKLKELENGLEINIKGETHKTARCSALIISQPNLPERIPPIRFRKNIPTTWISVTITEGKYHQVRKMTAKIGYPTLRLVRHAMEALTIDNQASSEVIELSKDSIYKHLFS